MAGDTGDEETIEVRGDMIRLGQLLKFAGLAESGAHAGQLVADGDVEVDGHVEDRRGRQLGDGALVVVRLPEAVHRLRVRTGG